MGYYINEIDGKFIGHSFKEKCVSLEKAGAIQVSGETFEENLVVVVDNIIFGAAGYAFSEKEYNHFKEDVSRTKKWYTIENADVLSGYKKI